MKKFILSILCLVFVVSIGFSQNDQPKAQDIKTKLEKPVQNNPRTKAVNDNAQKTSSVKVTSASTAAPQYSTAERSKMDALKKSDVNAYRAYLKNQADIKNLECLLKKGADLSPDYKAKIEEKLNALKSKNELK